MFNGFYDFSPFKNSFEIYFGGGIGAATAPLTTISLGQALDESATVFAYQKRADRLITIGLIIELLNGSGPVGNQNRLRCLGPFAILLKVL